MGLQPPQNPQDFFAWLKAESERVWASYDSSFKNSRWLPGLTDEQITEFERRMGFSFPAIYKMYLRSMNGTTECHFNIAYDETLRGGSDATDWYLARKSEEVHSHLFHSYPRDFRAIRTEIGEACALLKVRPEELNKRDIPHIMPLRSGSFLVMDRCEANPVLQTYPDYPEEGSSLNANSLQEFLAFRILNLRLDSFSEEPYVKFWVDYDDGAVRCPECGMDTVSAVHRGFWIFRKATTFSCHNAACPSRGKPFEVLIRTE
jgi:hypothetical protein